MHFAQHIILSWFTAEGGKVDDLTDRRLITFPGVVPDLDVIPYAAAIGYNWLAEGMEFKPAMQKAFDDVHSQIHHVYTHGIGFIVITFLAVLAIMLFRKKRGRDLLKVPLLAGFTSLMHCLCDVLASGPTWPIYPFWPFSKYAWGYKWSWTLADWPNLLLLVLFFIAARQYGVYKGRTVIEVFSVRADRWFVKLIRGK
ncbi:MAG: metal-dependent hydrolase [Planctomycetota bacterium]|jgi:membrane-bound metal-dependent hydrolase YbcI (DUF457 family)